MHRNFNDYELIYSVRDKDEFAFDLIVDKYMPIILSETKKYYPFVKKCGEEFDDLVQIALKRKSLANPNNCRNFANRKL